MFKKVLCALVSAFLLADGDAAELLPPGFRPLPLGVHALTGAKVVIKPGEVLEAGTVLIRDGLIQEVGKDIQPPADARIWDLKGLTIYPGFIDSYLTAGTGTPATAGGNKESDLTSGRFFGVPGSELDPGNPGAGSFSNLINPDRRVGRTYAPDPKFLEKMRELGFVAGNLAPEKGIFRGQSAFVSLADDSPNNTILRPEVFQHFSFNGEGGRENGYPSSLMGIIAAVRQTWLDVGHYQMDRANAGTNKSRKPALFNPALEALVSAKAGETKVVFESSSALMTDRASLMAKEFKLDLAIVASGEEWRRPDLAKAAGVPFIVPLAFPELSKMPEDDDWNQLTLDQLRAWDWAPENPALLKQQGMEVALTTFGLGDKKNFRRNLKGAIERGLSEDDALAALTTVPAKLCGVEDRLGTIEQGKLASLIVVDGDYFKEGKLREVWVDGRVYRMDVARAKEAKKEDDKKEAEVKELQRRVAKSPLQGKGSITNPAVILVQNATIWTSSKAGILSNATLLVQNGKISKVGKGQGLDSGTEAAITIDGAGLHVTPGLIDCHSHSMILGDVNEPTHPSTAMVGIGDVVNSETSNIREQLAGGLTIANLLHGSANPIGGRNQVIKLREGASPEELKFVAAPPGIKFALGENVKQANWGEKYTTRFPQTRMGVKTFINNRFIAAQQYIREWEKFRKEGGLQPRLDLELETIAEIIQGKRWIHCHSYRQDEILMMLRLMQEFGVTVGTFQHISEGYKVADELAKGGVGASGFADWWAYKFEVIDGIPHNGAILHERGVLVSFNSDSSDLARRLNTEAAKAVKFGGVSEEEALKFVTINPAKQLRIDRYVGSLEPGKDADFAIWSGNPLDSSSICLETWIEGKKYFDRDVAQARAQDLQTERQALIEKAKKVLKVVAATGAKPDPAGKEKFFRKALEHLHEGHARHCED